MTIGNVGVQGQSKVYPKNKETSVVKGTVVAGVAGATCGAVKEVLKQKSGVITVPSFKLEDVVRGVQSRMHPGKSIAKSGAIGAAIVAGSYLVYRGIKALCTPKQNTPDVVLNKIV